MNAFITSQFSYAPVVWMFHSRKQNHHINRIHERALRVAYKDYNSSFDELFEKDNSCNNGSKIGFLKTSLANFVKLTSNELVTNCQIKYVFFIVTIRFRSGSTCPVTPGIGVFKAIVNDWYLLTMCRRNLIPGVPGVLTIFSGWIFVMSMCWFPLLLLFLNTLIQRWQRKLKFLNFQGLFYPIKQESQSQV